MRPLIITALYPPAVGGAATYFGDIVPRLAQQEKIEHLFVLTEKMGGQPPSESNDRLTVLRSLPTRVSLPAQTRLTSIVRYAQAQLWFSRKLGDLVRQQQIDLIHFHTRYRGLLFYRARQRCGLPVLADLRDKMSDPAKLADVATHLLCCSQGVYQFAVAGGFPAKFCDLVPVAFQPPSALSPEEATAVQQKYHLPRQPFILFVGDITTNKGVFELLEAYQTWSPQHPTVGLIIAGVNREGDFFLNQVEKVEGAIYLSHIPHNDVLALMQTAVVVILPSRSEGLPRVILEAISLGTKVICPPNIPEFEQHLPDNTLSTVESLALANLLEDVWTQERTPTYPLELHTPEHVVEAIIEVYRKLTLKHHDQIE